MAAKKQAHSVFNNVCYLFRDISRHFRLLLVMMAVEVALDVLMPYLQIYLPKVAVDLVTRGASMREAMLAMGGLALLLTAAMAVKSAAKNGKYIQYNEIRIFYVRKLIYKTFDCDYVQIENAEGQTGYRKALGSVLPGDISGTSRMVTSIMALLPGALSLFVYSGVIARLHPLIVLLLAGLSAVNFFSLRHAQRYEQVRKDSVSELEKKFYYIDNATADIKAGKDVRIYRMAVWFALLQEQLIDHYVALRRAVLNRYFASGAVNALALLLRDGAAYAYLIWAVSAGRITIGDFVFYFGAISGFSSFVSQIFESLNTLYGASLQMNDLRNFLERTDPPEPESPAEIPLSEAGIAIEFDHVRFSYGEESDPILKDICLTISPGEKVAIVGVNGAGKTTLVKLLCGFYRPQSGHIRVGGIDIDRFRRQDLFRLFSAIFQDITILPISVAENVSLQTDQRTDRERVRESLRKSGLDAEIAKYNKGIDACMLRVVADDGIVLSGGQQQKLLMARALYKDAPVFIFDEPTAAMDPIAESEVYENFHSLAQGKTTLYISHRLASTRFCDRIAFIQDGRVAEYGSHTELMRQEGGYARMYNIQSHYYRHDAEDQVS